MCEVLDGGICLLDRKYRYFGKKERNMPIILIAQELLLGLKKRGVPYKTRPVHVNPISNPEGKTELLVVLQRLYGGA